jgi:prephenate dehydrogenase
VTESSIAIIGAGGQMGQWFARYFSRRGFEVVGYDSDNEIPKKDVTPASSLVGAILRTDYVLLCTPTRRTPEIIRLIAKEMKRGAYLIEISSQKAKTVSALSKVPAKISPVSIHPMFGPGARSIKNQNIVSIPIRNGKMELDVAKSLFGGANFVTIDANEHDKKMAMILGLTHLVNLVFASIVSKDEKISLTERMSGTTFKSQKILAESIMRGSPELIETIVSNPEIRRYAEELWKDVGRMLTAVQDNKTEEIIKYIETCQGRLSENADVDRSYRRHIKMINSIEKM